MRSLSERTHEFREIPRISRRFRKSAGKVRGRRRKRVRICWRVLESAGERWTRLDRLDPAGPEITTLRPAHVSALLLLDRGLYSCVH